ITQEWLSTGMKHTNGGPCFPERPMLHGLWSAFSGWTVQALSQRFTQSKRKRSARNLDIITRKVKGITEGDGMQQKVPSRCRVLKIPSALVFAIVAFTI